MSQQPLSHADEYALYRRDRPAWVRYIAPKYAEMLRAETEDGKRKLWAVLAADLRKELKRIA